MHSFCLLTSMELILIPNCSLLYLHSNDMNSSKSLFLKKKKSCSSKYSCCARRCSTNELILDVVLHCSTIIFRNNKTNKQTKTLEIGAKPVGHPLPIILVYINTVLALKSRSACAANHKPEHYWDI